MIEDIEDWRESQYQDFQAELGKEVESEVVETIECEHCKGRIPCSDELGVEEHCPHCGNSIFASPEDVI